jgi:hypothetical protein
MAMDIGKKKGPRNEINVTPLIDVVLVLLIIFMVLTPSMLKHLTAAVPKTEADATAPPSAEVPIIVEYAANRQLELNGEPVASKCWGISSPNVFGSIAAKSSFSRPTTMLLTEKSYASWILREEAAPRHWPS